MDPGLHRRRLGLPARHRRDRRRRAGRPASARSSRPIGLILGTARGERPMRPEFGCRIHDHVFGPANGATAGQIAYDVREALERWEPRIAVQSTSGSLRRGSRHGACTSTSTTRSADQRPAQPGLPVLRDPRPRRCRAAGRTCGHSSRLATAGQEVMTCCPPPISTTARSRRSSTRPSGWSRTAARDWTDHNVSDPGVTLIEAFAQMVDQLIYRLNRVPDLQLRQVPRADRGGAAPPGRRARGRVTFWLSAPQPQPVRGARARPQVSTPRTDIHDPVVFTTLAS